MATNPCEPDDTDDVVAAMDALHAALTDDLGELQAQIDGIDQSRTIMPASDKRKLARYLEARTALHSGLASISEVLGWIAWKTEEDPVGDVAVALQPLPTLRGCSIH